MARSFSVDVRGRTVSVEGDLDLASAPIFEASVEPMRDTPGDVTIDASALAFIDSSGIRSILGLARHLEGRGRVRIVAASEQVLRVLDLVRADAVVDIQHSSL